MVFSVSGPNQAVGESPSITAILKHTIPFALVAHQLCRRYETYSFLFYVFVLLGPPTFVAAHVSSCSDLPCVLANADVLRISIGTYLLMLTLSIIIYRLSPFHPLARYPGPIWATISMFGPALLFTTGCQAKYVKSLHERYGDVVRVGPNMISIRDPSALTPLMGSSGQPKGPDWVGGMLSTKNLPLVAIPNIDEHLQRRRAWNRGLGPAALKEYEQVLFDRAQLLVKGLEDHKGSKVDLGNWFNWFSYDLMSDMAFGGGSDLLRDGDENSIWSVLEKGMAFAIFFAQLPWLGVFVGYIPGAAQPLNALHAHGQSCARQRLERGSIKTDLFHYLNNEDLADTPAPPARQLIDDGILAVVAGSDTTSSALTSIFICLLTHPEAYAALQDEVDRFYPAGESAFNTKHHRNMPYLQAVINEALRLFPPVASGGSRKVPPGADAVVAGSIYIPPDTTFNIPPWSLQRDLRNFVFPDTFWPERWLVASGHLSLSDAQKRLAKERHGEFAFVHNDHAFVPFSYGPMNCPGKALAMQEMHVVVCALVQKFRVRLHLRAGEGLDGEKERYEREIKDYFTATRPEIPVVLELR